VAESFATTFSVGFVLVLLTFIPIAFLPRKREASSVGGPSTAGGEVVETPAMIH